MLPNIHILGIQGSGKGTQSALLVEKYGFSYISSGNLFRLRANQEDKFGRDLKKQLSLGKLLPDSFLLRTVQESLQYFKITAGILGDGVIRTHNQNLLLNKVWPKYNLDEPYLIHLILSEEIALERINQRKLEQHQQEKRRYHLTYSGKLLHRNDDNPIAINERFKLYHQMTEPVIKDFSQKDRLIHIEANRSIESINKDICQHLESIFPNLKDIHAAD